MYCPTCGSEERQLSQYCRACGTDLRAVRITLERPDAVTASAVSARDHISRAIADRIRDTQSAGELKKVAEEVLPEIEKFLESPEEKRLRRLRTGVVMSFIGLGACTGAIVASLVDEDLFVLTVPGLVLFFIGLAVAINGLLFTKPRKELPQASDADIGSFDVTRNGSALEPAVFPSASNLVTGERRAASMSVTEHTTKHLGEKP